MNSKLLVVHMSTIDWYTIQVFGSAIKKLLRELTKKKNKNATLSIMYFLFETV